MKTIRLRPGKERAALRGHPWIFDSAIAGGSADSGETVKVEGSDGKFLGWAAFSPASKIKLRISKVKGFASFTPRWTACLDSLWTAIQIL